MKYFDKEVQGKMSLFLYNLTIFRSSQDQRMTNTSAASDRLKNDRANNNVSSLKSKK